MQDVHYTAYPVDNVSELRSTLHALLEGSQVRQQLQETSVEQHDTAAAVVIIAALKAAASSTTTTGGF